MADFRRIHLAICWAILTILGLPAWHSAIAAEPPSLEDKIFQDVDADLKKGGGQGRFGFEIVGADGKPIEAARFVRGIPGQFSVNEFPRSFSIEGHSLFEAGSKPDAQLAQGGVTIYYDAPPDADGEAARYVSHATANLPTGKYSIEPFGLTFEVGQNIRPTHPGLTLQGNTLRIKTASVTFRAIDARNGKQVPLADFHLLCGKTDLLKDLLDTRETPGFNPLTLYLPVATSYSSTFGDFAIDERGAIQPSPAAAKFFEDGAFVQKVEPKRLAAPMAPMGHGYWLASQNLRRVYKRGEAAPFLLIAVGDSAASKLTVLVHGDHADATLGQLDMPAVTGSDSELFLLDTSALAPGKYELTVKAADAHGFGFEVVDLLPTTPLYLFTMNSCGESPFTLDSAGLDQLRDTGVRCWSQYGHGGALDTHGPGVVPYPAAPADAPPELQRPVSDARALLDDGLRHGLVTIGYENRRLGWYMEGLSFHHSHPLSVERMVRRVQIFGQELGDYPAFAGMTYTWFPVLGGYVEGGVPTDPFYEARMQALRANVKQQTGLEPLTEKQWHEWQQAASTEAGVPRALADQQRNYWRAEQHLGYFETFDLYNRKLREVRASFIGTTACDAGHDSGQELAEFCGAHDVSMWESYTDFGDWPLSAVFSSDWAHGMSLGKPQWQQVESSQSDPAIVAKQFYKLARGVEGIGVGVNGPTGARSNARRGLANHFLERYGSLVSDYQPDMTVAVCANELQDRAQYHAHALHSHLTRLGYGPQILSERTIEKGVPAGVKAIFIPNLRIPFSSECEQGLKDFMARGGKVVLVGEHSLPLAGAVRIEVSLKQIWEIGGFPAHEAFWAEFKKVRPALEKALADLQLTPPNGAAPEKAVILPLRCGGQRYVVVVSSPQDRRENEFVAVSGVTVNVGSATQVLNLVTGKSLPVQDGKVTLDLVSEPAALLALLDAAPTGITLHYPAAARAGEQIQWNAEVQPTVAGNTANNVAGVPVQYVLRDADGKHRAVFYRLSGASRSVNYSLPATEAAGNFTLSATELWTGLTVQASIKVAPAPDVAAVAAAPDIYIPHPDRAALFLSRQGEVRVIVEDTQPDVLADAQRLVAALRKAGRPANIEKVEPSNFDSLKLHWFATKHDNDLLAKIDAGEVIGFRQDLKPYISTVTRKHIPEKGGWADILPSYVVRNDVIVFSGGRLSDSLRAVSDWLETPNFPGKGTGVIEVALSPFWADREALAVVSNDPTGRQRTVERLLELIAGGKLAEKSPFAAAPVVTGSAQVTGAQRSELETPLQGFIPPALVQGINASTDGYAVVQTEHATTLLSPPGKVLRSLPRSEFPPTVATGGLVTGAGTKVTRTHPAWLYAMAWKVIAHFADAQGSFQSLDLGEVDWMEDRSRGWDGGYATSPDGKTYFAGLADGGFILFDLPSHARRVFPYDPRAIHYFETTRAPRFVSAARFSPDGQFVAYSFNHYPTGYGPLGHASANPISSAIRVVRVADGQTVWEHEVATLRDSSFATVSDALAVAANGKRVAMVDWYHQAVLFDATGKEILRRPLFDWKERFGKEDQNNRPPLRAELALDGTVALFASGETVLLTDDAGAILANIVVPALCDARLSSDGARCYVADADGQVTCFDRRGTRLWSVATQGALPKLAVSPEGLLVGEGAGNLLLLDAKGAEVRRTPLVNSTSPPPTDVHWTAIEPTGRPLYREPQTLAVLQKYGAKPAAQWTPTGEAIATLDHKFYPVASKITLSAADRQMHVVHLVYRHRAAAGQGPTVILLAGGKERTFVLDLPTPEYRVVDLPCEEQQPLTVTVAPAAGLEVADLSIYTMILPGQNGLYVKPATVALEHLDGLETAGDKGRKEKPDDIEILDDKDPTQVAKAAAGKMKNAAIFSRNSDPDQVEGHYLRKTGSPLDSIDGRKFLDGKPSAWSKSEFAEWGTTLVVDLNHHARPKLCVTYERTLRQSEVMKAIGIARGDKASLDAAHGGPDGLALEPRCLGGLLDNDQFFNVFDITGAEMDVLGVFIYSGRDKDQGLSEIELFE